MLAKLIFGAERDLVEITKATGKPPKACWCMTATFSSELLDRVPEEAKNKACICEKCVVA